MMKVATCVHRFVTALQSAVIRDALIHMSMHICTRAEAAGMAQQHLPVVLKMIFKHSFNCF